MCVLACAQLPSHHSMTFFFSLHITYSYGLVFFYLLRWKLKGKGVCISPYGLECNQCDFSEAVKTQPAAIISEQVCEKDSNNEFSEVISI